ncbi:Hypothetical predicted protein [Scomber scombrus]|uniref:Uncharacterized protein n=1 Tax=Scomber scombrus TaxID=13677 RepID=A0AAV1MQI0_SCOSC
MTVSSCRLCCFTTNGALIKNLYKAGHATAGVATANPRSLLFLSIDPGTIRSALRQECTVQPLSHDKVRGFPGSPVTLSINNSCFSWMSWLSDII